MADETEARALLQYVESIDKNMAAHRRESAVQHFALMDKLDVMAQRQARHGVHIILHRRALYVLGMLLAGVIVYLTTRDPKALAEIVQVAK
jgi:hypothetical protein